MDKNKRRQTRLPVRDCKLSELGKCKRRFRPKTYNQEFCKPQHQAKYWRIIKSEKRLVIRDLVKIIERYNETKYEFEKIKEWNKNAIIEPEPEEEKGR